MQWTEKDLSYPFTDEKTKALDGDLPKVTDRKLQSRNLTTGLLIPELAVRSPPPEGGISVAPKCKMRVLTFDTWIDSCNHHRHHQDPEQLCHPKNLPCVLYSYTIPPSLNLAIPDLSSTTVFLIGMVLNPQINVGGFTSIPHGVAQSWRHHVSPLIQSEFFGFISTL